MSEPFDVVLYGATGFTGGQAARYVAAHAPAGLRWAIAGRSRDKLDALATEINPSGVVVADSGRPATVDAMVEGARVVLTTAGPFAKYGTPVVEACARHGRDYVDITGETPWAREMIDRFHHQAVERRARIIPFCGFDSVPSDLGTLMAVEALRERGTDARRVMAAFKIKGGLNGGTLDSALTMAERGLQAEVADVLLLNPRDHQSDAERQRSADFKGVVHDDDLDAWLTPFFMAPINTRVVRRSNALFDQWGRAYGPRFTYNEAIETSGRTSAYATAAVSAAFMSLTNRSWARILMRRYGPAPGQGPSEKSMDGGVCRTRLIGEGEDGSKVLVTLKAPGDPGNRVTVPLLCEAALMLATDRAALPGGDERGGLLTPATALGLGLLERLRSAGFEARAEPFAPAGAAKAS